MKNVLIISDTHGRLKKEVWEAIKSSDVVIHAGDLDNNDIEMKLRLSGAEVHIVKGNNDNYWGNTLPKTLTFKVEGVTFFLVHNKRDVPPNLKEVDVIVYGHSHRYDNKMINGVTWLNPGSCSVMRFSRELTMCRMKVNGASYSIEKVVLKDEIPEY